MWHTLAFRCVSRAKSFTQLFPSLTLSADVGDSAWGAELPADAVHDMKEAKGTIYETADQPWW